MMTTVSTFTWWVLWFLIPCWYVLKFQCNRSSSLSYVWLGLKRVQERLHSLGFSSESSLLMNVGIADKCTGEYNCNPSWLYSFNHHGLGSSHLGCVWGPCEHSYMGRCGHRLLWCLPYECFWKWNWEPLYHTVQVHFIHLLACQCEVAWKVYVRFTLFVRFWLLGRETRAKSSLRCECIGSEGSAGCQTATLGDLEVLAAAVFYAIHTIRLGVHAKSMSALELSTRVMMVSTIFTFGWAGYDYTTAALEGVISCPLSAVGLIGQWISHRVFLEVESTQRSYSWLQNVLHRCVAFLLWSFFEFGMQEGTED